MKYAIEPRDGYLHATVFNRDTAEQMREFLFAVHAACREHALAKILLAVRRSRAMFKPEDYGLAGAKGGYVNELLTPVCRVALVGDTDEVNSANEYIELVARQRGFNVRAFRDEQAAQRWLGEAGRPARRYRFTRIVIAGAPEAAGVYALWDDEEVIYYGRADGKNEGGGSTIRSRLLAHYYEDKSRKRPTHYSWEVCADPAAREAELLREHEAAFGRRPRENEAA
jgi:hypothetical protein